MTSATPHPGLERLIKDRIRDSTRVDSMLALAREAGVKPGTIYAWFKGSATPRTESLGRVGEVLQLSLHELWNAYESGRAPGEARNPRDINEHVAELLASTLDAIKMTSGQWVQFKDAFDDVTEHHDRRLSQVEAGLRDLMQRVDRLERLLDAAMRGAAQGIAEADVVIALVDRPDEVVKLVRDVPEKPGSGRSRR